MKDFQKYNSEFSDSGFWNKIGDLVKSISQRTIYTALLLYYAFRRKETPTWAKNIVIGVLGYFISPIDFIPDLTPIIGYTDDIGVLSFGLVTIACFVNDEVKLQSRQRMAKWFNSLDEGALADVDAEL